MIGGWASSRKNTGETGRRVRAFANWLFGLVLTAGVFALAIVVIKVVVAL